MAAGRLPAQPVPRWPGGGVALGWPGEGARCSMTPGRLMVTACLLLVLGVPDLAAAASRRVPILHSFGRDFGPFQVFSSAFRTVLVRDSPDPIEFQEATLESRLFGEGQRDDPVVHYANTLHAARPIDLLVAVGGPAAFGCRR